MTKIYKSSKVLPILITCFAIATSAISIAHNSEATIVVTDHQQNAHLKNPKDELMLQAIRYNDLNTVKALINSGMGINDNIEGDGTPLIIAVQRNKIALVKALINLGADVNQATHIDGNALINAAMKNNLELAEILFEAGANLDAVVVNDETALITASRAGHFEMVTFLVENGADINLEVQVTKIDGTTEYRSPINGAKTTKILQYLQSENAKT